MSRLIKFEFRKLFHAKVLYICAALLVALVFLFAGINKLEERAMESMFSEELGYESDDDLNALLGSSSSNSGATWVLGSLGSIYMIIIFAAFISVYFNADFGSGVIKNIFTKGYSRSEVFFAKYLVCLAVSVCYALLAMLAGFIAGCAFWEPGTGWSAKYILLIFAQLMVIAGYNSLFCLFAVLFKKMGPSMVLSIAVPIILPLVLSLAELLINRGSVQTVRLSIYWLSGCLSGVSTAAASGGDIARGIFCSCCYIAVFTVLGWLKIRKREV